MIRSFKDKKTEAVASGKARKDFLRFWSVPPNASWP